MVFTINTNDLLDKENNKQFREDISKFLSQNGKDQIKNPMMGGKELDLYKLFKEVVLRGGCHYVLENKLWKDVVNSLDIPSSCTSASFLLKNHYMKYLLMYEQYYFKMNNKIVSNNQTQGNTNYKSTQDIPHGVHIQPNSNLEQKFLGKKVIRTEGDLVSNLIFRPPKQHMYFKDVKEKIYNRKVRLFNAIPDLKRTVLAFESHITSEIIWAINVLLLFSSNQNCNLIIENQPYLIESITNYIYYCMNNISDFSNLFTHSLSKETSKDNKEKSLKQVNKEYNFLNESSLNSTTPLPLLSKKEKSLYQKDKFRERVYDESYEEIMENEILEHLISILQIIRNLSFIRPNEPTIIKNNKLMSIIYVLFINSNLLEIQSNCLDIISNLSKHILLKDTKNAQAILDQIYFLVKSPIKDLSESALECLRRMTFPNGNEEFYEKLNEDFYDEMVNLLIHPKLEIRETVLEILYVVSDQMSSKVKLGKTSCCIERLIGLLCVSSNDNRIAKFSACILSNLAIIPYNQKMIMPYEEQLFLAACVDESLTKSLMGIISN